VAALSADPATLAELEFATERFVKRDDDGGFFGNLSPGSCAEPYDAGLLVIDLAARLVVVDSIYSSPEPVGCVSYDDGQHRTEVLLRYHLAEDWHFTHDGTQWHALAQARHAQRAAEPPLDARQVFYGRPLLEYIAREIFAASRECEAVAHDVRPQWIEETIREIHAAWLLTPRPDLGGASPREVAMAHRDHLTWDLQDRCEQWSRLGECPRGLDESSFAFRYGGFGTHELVEYYDLVRALLWSSWEQLASATPETLSASSLGPLSANSFVTLEVPRLETVREQWLDSPDPECHNRTPRSIIHRERTRIPEAVSGHDAMVDPDCPCCQMMADMPGPVFWGLDGSCMDDDFAFDISCRTRDEWEARRREWDETSRKVGAEMDERKRLGLPGNAAGGDEDASLWTASYRVDDTADVPLGVRLFGLGCHLAELITQLRDGADRSTLPPETQQLIDRLNRDFGNLRDILQQPGPELAAALFDPVIDCFGETLARVAANRADLAAKCESLGQSLSTLIDEPPPEPAWDAP
jgi:hypothetical protein